jgi:hypothetical protein
MNGWTEFAVYLFFLVTIVALVLIATTIIVG